MVTKQPRRTPEDDDNGVIEDWLVKMLGRSWRTTLTGVGVLVCAVLPVIPGMPSVVVDVVRVVGPIVGGTGLLFAKDTRVSGTDKQAAPLTVMAKKGDDDE